MMIRYTGIVKEECQWWLQIAEVGKQVERERRCVKESSVERAFKIGSFGSAREIVSYGIVIR